MKFGYGASVGAKIDQMKRAALYIRVSTTDQHTAAQVPELEQLVKARGFRIVDRYFEEVSATKKRPHLESLMRCAHKGYFDVVVVWALDRLGRSMLGNIGTVLELNRLGVQVVSVREAWLDTTGPMRDLLLAIFSWVAEQERTRLVERTKAGMEAAR